MVGGEFSGEQDDRVAHDDGRGAGALPGRGLDHRGLPVVASMAYTLVLPRAKMRPFATQGVLEQFRPLGSPGARVVQSVFPDAASRQMTVSSATRRDAGMASRTACLT